jgi:hypothetical protein
VSLTAEISGVVTSQGTNPFSICHPISECLVKVATLYKRWLGHP